MPSSPRKSKSRFPFSPGSLLGLLALTAYLAFVSIALAAAPPVNTVAPSVTGNTEVGSTLTADKGTWTGDPTITYGYQWQRCEEGIPGVNWVPVKPTPEASWESVTWGGPAGAEKFVAVGSSNAIMTSPDGLSWSIQATPSMGNILRDVTWGGPSGQEKFVAVGDVVFGDVGSHVLTSPDGVNWSSPIPTPPGPGINWRSVTWGGPAGQEKFVAVARYIEPSRPTQNTRVMTSPDGVNWTLQAAGGTQSWWSVTWGGPAGQEKFVAVASDGTNNRVMTSPDGVNWTPQTSAANNFWRSVTWGGPAGQEKFVAVSSTGTDNRVMTSPTGVNWTSRTTPNSNWQSVTWGGPAGQEKFVAVANSGGDGIAMTSPDGESWTSVPIPIGQPDLASSWQSVTWGSPSGDQRFIAVSATGASDVMTSGPTCTNITGAINPTYKLTGDDEGKKVRVKVTASNGEGSATANSDLTATVQPGPTPPFPSKPSVKPAGSANATSLKLKVGCAGSKACTVKVTGKLKGGKGKVVPKTVKVKAGKQVVIKVDYTPALKSELRSKGGGRIAIKARQVGGATRTITVRVRLPRAVTG